MSAQEEREAIVAWLLEFAMSVGGSTYSERLFAGDLILQGARAIERGDHRKG